LPSELPTYARILGPPDPRLPSGLKLVSASDRAYWRLVYRDVGAGWYWDRFLFLFGAGVEELRGCLAAWSPLCGEDDERVVLGRNAYGAILFIDRAGRNASSRMRILDPFQLTCSSKDGENLQELFADVIPNNRYPAFFSNRLYEVWRKREGLGLAEDEILAPRRPEDEGGKWELANLAPEGLRAFFERTATDWAPAIARAAKRRSRRRETWL
jgi:hypothetical protein